MDYITANQISLNKEGNLEIVGTSEKSSKKKYIKSPYISIYNSDLEYVSSKTYKTNATANNPRLITQVDGSKTLSYYKPISLDYPAEKSFLAKLDQNYNPTEEISFGNRHRTHKILHIGNQRIILAYNRHERNIELSSSGGKEFLTQFTLNSEPSVPTDLEISRIENILFCGIQNGFQYPDGHDHNEISTFGFIVEMDQDGTILRNRAYRHDQHVFFNDIEETKESTILTGTKQQEDTSMDLLMVSYDDSLKIQLEKSFRKEGYQYGIKTKIHDQYYYTLILSENSNTKVNNFSLMKSDSLFQTVWSKDFNTDHSVEPVDFTISNQNIYCITNTESEDSNSVHAEIYMISLNGKLLKKQFIQ